MTRTTASKIVAEAHRIQNECAIPFPEALVQAAGSRLRAEEACRTIFRVSHATVLEQRR